MWVVSALEFCIKNIEELAVSADLGAIDLLIAGSSPVNYTMTLLWIKLEMNLRATTERLRSSYPKIVG